MTVDIIVSSKASLMQENARLKELNREMVGVITGLLTGDCERYEFVVKGRNLLAKAEGGRVDEDN